MQDENPTQQNQDGGAAQEAGAFLLLTAVIAPLLTVGLIAAYGFAIWIYQIFTGPPGS